MAAGREEGRSSPHTLLSVPLAQAPYPAVQGVEGQWELCLAAARVLSSGTSLAALGTRATKKQEMLLSLQYHLSEELQKDHTLC